MPLIYSFTLSLFLTIALIPLLLRLSAKLKLVDVPDGDRKIHDRAIPRSGGLAIVMGVFLPLLFLHSLDDMYKGLLVGAAVIAISGFLDDRFTLNYKWKFFGQILAVLLVINCGITINHLPDFLMDAGWLQLLITFMFILGVTNAVNLSDGLDGLAAGTSLISLVLITVLALLQNNHGAAIVSLSVIGGLLGFLRYNTFPARIFMGDTGSQFLGFVGACLAIMVTQDESSVISPVLPLLIFGIPVLDTLMVMTIRISQRRSPFSPDKNHLHHQLISLGLHHYHAVGFIYLMQVGLMVSAYSMRFENDYLLLIFYCFFFATVTALLSVALKIRESTPERIVKSGKDRRNPFFRNLHWMHVNSALIVESIIAIIFVYCAVLVGHLPGMLSINGLILVAIITVFYTLGKYFYPDWITRAITYSAGTVVIFFFSTASVPNASVWILDGILILLLIVLLLGIRVTRREKFQINNQDLLILAFVIVVPLMPFDILDNSELGKISLRLAVLMYGCEFILGVERSNYRMIRIASLVSLMLVGLPGAS